MSLEILEWAIEEICKHNFGDTIFVWHGGEPLLAGIEFYKRAIAFQEKFRKPGQKIFNGLVTDGTLIEKESAKFEKY